MSQYWRFYYVLRLTIWVQNKALYVIAFVAPFILQACVNLVTIRSWWDFHNATLGCMNIPAFIT